MKNIFHKIAFAVSVIMVLCTDATHAQTNKALIYFRHFHRSAKQTSFLCTHLSKTFKFEPSKSTVSGTIVVETFFDANGKKENSFVLKLDKPVKIIADPDDDYNSTTGNVIKVQLVADINLSIYKNRKVHCTGTFFCASSAHHHTAVLMSVETIQDRKQFSAPEALQTSGL